MTEHREPAGMQGPASDELLRLVFESAQDYAIFSMDPTGLVTSWNRGAERVLGWTTEEIMGRSGDMIFTPEDRAAGIPDQERAGAARDGRAEDDRWTMRRDGRRFWASGLMMPLQDRRLGFVKILRDLTEKHLAEGRLRETEERFRLLATHIPQLVFRGLSDGFRTWPSPQWIEFTGLGAEASLGFGWIDAIHPEDQQATRDAWRGAEQNGEYDIEHRVRRASDGQYRWHQTRARPIRGSAGTATDWVGTMTDVHDLRGLQERQKVMMAELQHRTRNLLAVTQAIATQTLRKSVSLEAFEREFESRLRALSRVQVLITGVDYKDVDLRDLLSAELQAHDGEKLDSGKVRMAGPAVPLPANAAQALGLALHELATNAAKYGALAQPSARLTITWRIEPRDDERWAELDWKESGVAMPPAGKQRRYGFGSELIECALPYQLGAETSLELEPDGVRCTISVQLKEDRNA